MNTLDFLEVTIPQEAVRAVQREGIMATIVDGKLQPMSGQPSSVAYRRAIHIRNASREESVDLELYGYLVDGIEPGLARVGMIKSDGLKLALGPGEETEGGFVIDHLPSSLVGKGDHILVIKDTISGRHVRVAVPYVLHAGCT